MQNFRRLRVYQLALDTTEQLYRHTAEQLPKDERYGLTSQMRRCAVSIPSNIAEGRGRSTDAATRNFLEYALGSTYELETQLVIAQRLGYGDPTALLESIDHLVRQLASFYRRLGGHL